MTTRDTAFAPGTPCWADLATSDLEPARKFYAALFGWDVEGGREEFGSYCNCSLDGQRVAGIFPKTPEMQFPDVWTTYMSTDDAQATADKVAESGGTVMQSPMPVGDLGVMVMATDPAGATFGLWQPGTHTGFQKYNETGAVTWDEHHSKDFPATTQFYADVCGWTYDTSAGDTDEFRYYQGQVDGETVAGLMDSKAILPDEVPSHWAVYFSVDDADEAAAKVTELGGTVVREPMDTPYGRLADVTDPSGAMFKLHSIKMADGSMLGADSDDSS